MKKTILSPLFAFKCPRCREGHLFVQPFSLKNAFNMQDSCEKCRLNYHPEPGFYFGAMFLSYIITAFAFVIASFFLIYVLGIDVDYALILVFLFAGIFFIYFYRLGRSVWLTMNVKYDPEAIKKHTVRQELQKEEDEAV